jgi:Mn2+/Fe2+ NRAMP family transporter
MIVPIAAVILALQIWGSYRTIVTFFKVLALAFLTYIGAALLAHPPVWDVLKGTFVPAVRLDGRFLATLVALFGTTISPYMWFWQASQEVEDEIAVGHRRVRERRGTTDAELRYAAWDINAGMVFSNVVAYFIILATAATLFKAGKTDIASAAQAAQALRPLAGSAAEVLFALGLLSSGFLAVPVLSGSAAYAVAEAFRWKHGLDQPLRRAPEFYLVIAASTVVGMLVNFAGLNPIDALFWTAVLNGFLTPPLLFLVMLISNNRKIMGDRANGPVLNAVGWLTFAVMLGAVAGLIATWSR